MEMSASVLLAVIAFGGYAFWDCRGNCFVPQANPAQLALQIGQRRSREDEIGLEGYVGYDLPGGFGPFRYTFGASAGGDGSLWAGAGVKWHKGENWFTEVAVMPGIYVQGDGPDLGGPLEIRSSIGLGRRFGNDTSVMVVVDHRSNADLYDENPGLETVSIRLNIPLD